MDKLHTSKEFKIFLSQFVTSEATEPICKFLSTNNIFLKISTPRTSKLGDYTLIDNQHKISVNGDLDKNSFLWVLLHEIAHYQTTTKYFKRVNPHGIEWQKKYVENIKQFQKFFPSDTQELITTYISSLPLKKSIEQKIIRAFKTLSPNFVASEHITVNNLSINDMFLLNGHRYQIIEKRRTRYKCLRLDNKIFYLVAESAEITPIKRQ